MLRVSEIDLGAFALALGDVRPEPEPEPDLRRDLAAMALFAAGDEAHDSVVTAVPVAGFEPSGCGRLPKAGVEAAAEAASEVAPEVEAEAEVEIDAGAEAAANAPAPAPPDSASAPADEFADDAEALEAVVAALARRGTPLAGTNSRTSANTSAATNCSSQSSFSAWVSSARRSSAALPIRA